MGDANYIIEDRRRVGDHIEKLGGIKIGQRKEEGSEEGKEEEADRDSNEERKKKIIQQSKEGELMEMVKEDRQSGEVNGKSQTETMAQKSGEHVRVFGQQRELI